LHAWTAKGEQEKDKSENKGDLTRKNEWVYATGAESEQGRVSALRAELEQEYALALRAEG
jgi:hypothetical protein